MELENKDLEQNPQNENQPVNQNTPEQAENKTESEKEQDQEPILKPEEAEAAEQEQMPESINPSEAQKPAEALEEIPVKAEENPENTIEMEETPETMEQVPEQEKEPEEDTVHEPFQTKEPDAETPVTASPAFPQSKDPNTGNSDFDWEKYEQDDVKTEEDEQEELKGLYTKTLSNIEDHELVQAKVVNITEKDVVLNIGFKSDGLIPLSEFKYLNDLKIGDEVPVLVESTEGIDGQLILSHKKARAEDAWNKILKAHESGEIMTGHIKDRTKGGMVVDLLGLDAFLPGSQLDIKPVQDYDAYVGTNIELKVVKLNAAFRNIVVSHKAIIEQDIEEQRHKILSKLEKGQVLEGIVKNLTSFGVFVDLGGVDGLIHITDVSWGRINHPNAMLEIGQKINVVVLDYDEDKKRISLGMKQLTKHPWETLPEDIVENSVIKGKVVNIEDYGAFIEIYPGVEGLVHVSEMTWSQHLKTPGDYVKLGDQVEVKVLSINREERKLSLGMKQLTPDPWESIDSRYPKESQHKAIVKNITNFGLFVELEEGIDGLIHISDLSWTKKYKHPAEFAKVADEIEVVVLDIDMENRRLSLGHKQLEEDPWETFKDIFSIGSIHEGAITKIDDKGASITLPYNIEGFCPAKQLILENDSKPNIDDVLEFKVSEFDKSNRNVIVSHLHVWKDQQKLKKEEEVSKKKKTEEHTRKVLSQVRSKVKKTTLASELDILQEIKDKMVADEKTSKSKSSKSKSDTDTSTPDTESKKE
jgi:small subunit ribosomal protein S1